MDFQPSDPYFNAGKSSSMLQAINFIPVGGVYINDAPPANTPPIITTTTTTGTATATDKQTILTPRNIMIGAGVICLFIVIVKSK